MFPFHKSTVLTDSVVASLSPTVSNYNTKLNHVKITKKRSTSTQPEEDTFIIMPFDEASLTVDELANKHSPSYHLSSSPTSNVVSFMHHHSSEEKQMNTCSSSSSSTTTTADATVVKSQQRLHWLLSSHYWGPFSTVKHWPLFTYITVLLNILLFSGELLLSRQNTGEFFELEPFNYMLGPSMEIMVQVGARFPPCMRPIESMPFDARYVCLHTIAASSKRTATTTTTTTPGSPLYLLDPVIDLADPHIVANSTCSLATICGMSTFHLSQIPDQKYRLFTPLFIHTGLVHLFINLTILCWFGIKVEKVMNSLRFMILYIGAGIFGHALGANFAPATTPFLGFSSSLFGLIGFLYVDLFIHWKRLEQAIRYMIKLLLGTAFSFILGLLPGVDNFSHLGGLVAGILLSLFLSNIGSRKIGYSRRIGIYLIRFLSLCLYGALLALLIHHFDTSKIDEVCNYKK
ncbi:uncharacterized protein BX663DRAFT_11389 [Cokeromyces recurvatus]|uniref:uncharacterized protein n=1 Tax=Cokeromyces recurvatus TaxID=90255 RepID=UPI00221F2008|nr:uncharacterized protein BX663DRAFT_11389 [Cokeromyces recurvatus]KAI7907803.1 hypothetical protein BX663DRAFT_11389 [Cokeromyces recurvatus]